MKKRKLSILIPVLLSVIPAFAETITVQQATELALKNNKSIKSQMLQVERSKITLDKTWRSTFFSVDYTASAGRYFKDIAGTNSNYGQSLSLTQPIYTGGKNSAVIKYNKESLEVEELTLDSTKKAVILNTVQAYINVYDAQNTLEVYKASKKALDETLEVQKAQYNLRMVTRPEYLESERAVKAMEANILSQEATVEINKETLGNLIGMNGQDIDIVPFGVNEKFTSLVNLKDDLERLKTSNTEYLITLKNKKLAERNVDIEKADLRPTVAGTASYGTLTETGSSRVSKVSELGKGKNNNGSVGVSFSWNLFDWGARKLDVKAAQKNVEIADLAAEQKLDDLKVSLKNVYYKIQALEKSMEALKTAVDAAEETYNLEQERYRHRLITLNDLLTAETNLRQARTNYLSSRLNYYYLVSQYGSLLD